MGQNDSAIPAHVAIILDGNGRWAKSRGLSRLEGHKAGGEALRRLLDDVIAAGVGVISLYAFSTENWKRPSAEVLGLWNLMEDFFTKYRDLCLKRKIRVRISGDLTRLPGKSQKILRRISEETKDFGTLTANFCINYGSRAEITRACNRLIEKTNKNERSGPVTEEEISSELYTSDLPEVDLLIRPGGESRVSNFLLWQCAYAELYFTDIFWPDFSKDDLNRSLEWFAGRKRRFGMTDDQLENENE